jgi:hypothetical protein
MSYTDALLKSLSNYIDWRTGDIDDMPDPKEITLTLKKCYNIINGFDIAVRHTKTHEALLQKLKDILK